MDVSKLCEQNQECKRPSSWHGTGHTLVMLQVLKQLGRISINTDASCPMMQIADLAIVADGPEVLTALERLLGEEGSDEH